jgi:hypothetical protein
MSWLQSLASFGFGFAKGYIEARARQGAFRGPQASDYGYDFCGHMTALSEATDFRIQCLQADSVLFAVPFQGTVYSVLLVARGGKIVFSMFSNIAFPEGSVPGPVIECMRGMNREMPHCDFDIIDFGGESHCCAVGSVDAHALNPHTFTNALGELVATIAAHDKVLRKHGYA